MGRVILTIDRLGTDVDGQVLHYEVKVGTSTLIGDFVGSTSASYERVIAEVEGTPAVAVVTPDARMSVRVQA